MYILQDMETVIERVVERCFDMDSFTEEDVVRMCEEEEEKLHQEKEQF